MQYLENLKLWWRIYWGALFVLVLPIVYAAAVPPAMSRGLAESTAFMALAAVIVLFVSYFAYLVNLWKWINRTGGNGAAWSLSVLLVGMVVPLIPIILAHYFATEYPRVQDYKNKRRRETY